MANVILHTGEGTVAYDDVTGEEILYRDTDGHPAELEEVA